MEKLILAAVFTMIATLAQAEPNLTSSKDSSNYDIQQVLTSQAIVQSFKSNNQEICARLSVKGMQGQRGCCSWHQGVCGCADGRVVCCDGTLSPSCTCHHDEKIEN